MQGNLKNKNKASLYFQRFVPSGLEDKSVCVPTGASCYIARGLLLTREIAAFLCCSTLLYFNFLK